jgi:hypothetical protein
MRGGLYFAAAALVALVAFWAYKVNYAAQGALERVADLRAEIARERESIAVLEAEWAYLNAPERLERLVRQHGETLGLGPMRAANFGSIADAPTPEVFWAHADAADFKRLPDQPGASRP